MAVWSVFVDFDSDGSFSGDLVANVKEIRWTLGMEPYAATESDSSATITLDNRTGGHSPENAAKPLSPGLRCRVESFDGTTVRAHFVGNIREIRHVKPDEIVVVVDTIFAQLRQVVTVPLLLDVQSGDAIDSVLDAAYFRHYDLDSVMILDSGQLDTHAVAVAQPIAPTLAAGDETFPYIGDTWGDGVYADEAIRQITEAEGGRFYTARDGEFVYRERTDDYALLADAATLSDDFADIQYTYGAGVISAVEIVMRPRSLGAAGSTLWTLGRAITLEPGQEREIRTIFRDDEGRRIGATDVQPLSGWTANSERDGTGDDLTENLGVWQIAISATTTTIRLVNAGSTSLHVQPGATVTGQPLDRDDEMVLRAVSHRAQTWQGSTTLVRSLPLLMDIEYAQGLAEFELSRREAVAGRAVEITVSEIFRSEALTLTLFDRITVQHTETGHDRRYQVVRETHTVKPGWNGTGGHMATFVLEPLAAATFFTLDVSELDSGDVIAF